MRLLILCLIMSSLLFGQNGEVEDIHPCDDPLLKTAQLEGIKSIPIKDMYRFKKLMKSCEEQGGGKQIEQIIYRDWERDFRRAKLMDSWTSTFSICVFLVAIYYFAGLVLATT